MMTTCPQCGSTDIVSDLPVYSGNSQAGQNPPYVSLIEPEPEKRLFIWSPTMVATGFRADICGGCGYTQFHTKHYAEILEAHKKGYTSIPYGLEKVMPI